MKHSSLLILLVGSLAMNLFTVAGYFSAQREAPVSDPAALVASELGLNDQQTDRFRALRAEMNEMVESYRGSQALLKQELMDEIKSDSPDTARIRELLTQNAEFERQLREDGAQRFGAFVSDLAPEQRQTLFRALHHQRPNRSHDRRLARFDTNGDGRLDEAERAAASEYYQQKRRQDGRRGERGNRDRGERGGRGDDANHTVEIRHHLLRRFDRNHDRTFDDAEIKALIDWLRADPRPQPGPGSLGADATLGPARGDRTI